MYSYAILYYEGRGPTNNLRDEDRKGDERQRLIAEKAWFKQSINQKMKS